MNKFQEMSVTELDRTYWDLYGDMRKYRDHDSYQNYCVIGGMIMKEFERRGLNTLDDICQAIKAERVNA